MGWRFRKSIKIAPGIKINIGKKGVSSLSVGPRGAHINIGKNGTNLSTGIPGTGIYNVTRLDKPAGSGMTQCPYCGHRMRKQWDACPKCHAPLLQKSEQQNIEPKNITPPSASDNPPVIDAEYAESKPQKTSKGSLGCGCLIIILIFMMIGSCMSGAGHKATPPAASSPASITTSSGNGQEPEEKVPIVPVSTQETKAATPAAPPAPTQTAEKKYYGNGPNGEGIKGHTGKNGKIYHLPGGTYYNRTKKVSQWFFTEKEAQAAGYRAAYK